MSTDQIIHHFLMTYIIPVVKSAVRDELRKQVPHANPQADEDTLLSAKEAAEFTGDALPTFYGRTSRGEIATYGSGKRIFIKKSELIEWKQQQRTKSKDQIREEVARDLSHFKIKTRR